MVTLVCLYVCVISHPCVHFPPPLQLTKRDITLVDQSGVGVKLTVWGETAQKPSSTFQDAILAIKGIKVPLPTAMPLFPSSIPSPNLTPSLPSFLPSFPAQLGDFGGRSLSAWSSTRISYNPDIPEATVLREWYNSTGKTAATETITQSGGGGGGGAAYDFAKRNTLADIEQHGLGQTDEVKTALTASPTTR